MLDAYSQFIGHCPVSFFHSFNCNWIFFFSILLLMKYIQYGQHINVIAITNQLAKPYNGMKREAHQCHPKLNHEMCFIGN